MFMAYFQKSLALIELRDFDKAIKGLKKAVELNPNLAEAYYQLGIAYTWQEKPDEALHAFITCTRLNQYTGDVNAKIAELFLNQGKYRNAVFFFNKALTTGGEKFAIYYHKARAHQALDELDEAYTSYQKVLEALPIFFMAQYNSGLVLYQQGKYEEALRAFDGTLKMNPRFSVALYQMGMSYLKMGKKRKAKELFQNYLVKAPNGEMATDAKKNIGKL